MVAPINRLPEDIGQLSSDGRTASSRSARPTIAQPIAAIRDTLNRVLPTYATGYVRPRTLLIPLDPWMRGNLRWARKFGGEGSVWRPDTVMTLDQDLSSGDRVIYVKQMPDSLLELPTSTEAVLAGIPSLSGAVVELSPTLRVHIDEWSLADFTLTIRGDETITESLAAGKTIKLYSFPISVEGSWPKSSTVFRVNSPALLLGIGDRLEIPLSVDDWRFTVPVTVTLVELIETDAEGLKYQLTVDTSSLPRALISDEVIYVRAFPAYFSNLRPLPDFSAQSLRADGPFLLDWLSGPLVTGVKYTEYASMRQYRNDRSPITKLAPVGHNAQGNVEPIQAEQLLFWKPIDGAINYDIKANEAVITCDANGHFRLVEPLAPHLEPPTTYARGTIVTVPKSNLVNNETITLGDGLTSLVFELAVTNPFVATPGRTTIDLRPITVITAEHVAAYIRAAIITSVLNIDVQQAQNILYLVNRTGGSAGNVIITETVSDAGFLVSGMDGGGGTLKWIFTLESPSAGYCYVQLHPNADQAKTLLPGFNSVSVELNPFTDDPATHIDFRIVATPGAELRCKAWTVQGSRTSFIEHNIIVHVESNQWAGSCLFLKPLWPTLDLLRAYPEEDHMNAGALFL